MIKELIHQEDKNVPSNRAPKYRKQKLTELKGETDIHNNSLRA